MQKRSLKSAAIALALVLSSCGFLPEKIDETRDWSASRLYSEARDELASGNYEKAIQHFEKLESRYPFGTYAQQAQMEIAYAHYRQGEQPEALAAADRFIKLHPNHPHVDYMYYLRGLINFNDRGGLFDFLGRQDPSERDPKAAHDAFESFRQLAERFPASAYTPDAIARMKYLVNALAQHQVHVANYYYRRGAYVAAANRAQYAVSEYRDAPAIEEALYIMMKSYDAMGMPELSKDAERVLRATFPNSEFFTGGRREKSAWWKFW
ncbi:MAG TPA: outer membrane protein assembly factor BamD [Noviherbaspirillum sp.]|jgi:outer membrane protein assembly factor BamD|uniref:outer membrane protein assembly factor BamD n=1 Tax=Noviherbaspirillum sp. TaxID=1926288 RepID=UPI002F93D92B